MDFVEISNVCTRKAAIKLLRGYSILIRFVVVIVISILASLFWNTVYNLDAVPPVHVVSNHVDIDKLTTANGGSFRRVQPVAVANVNVNVNVDL